MRQRPDPDAGRDWTPLFDGEHVVATDDGATLRVIERGEGIPVVLGHGVTNDVRSWTLQFEALPAEGIRVIAYDQRGHGSSVCGEDGFGIDRLALDVKAVLEGLDLHEAIVVGHSMGGIALQAFVSQHPEVVAERVAGIVLMSTLCNAPGHRVPLDRVPEALSKNGDVVFSWLLGHPNFGFFLARFGLGREPLPSHVEITRRMVAECPPETRLGATRPLVGFDLREVLADFDVETLVIGGTADILTPPFAARRLAGLIPGATLEMLPGAGHMPMLEAAPEVNRLIADFARTASGAVPARSA
jgi:pimeloyl-ACP methyl ester carboxylesterase